MKVKITPSKVSGTIAIPASKSISHRAIICASLAQGKSTITNLTFSKDIEATISCMRSFGAKIEVQKNTVSLKAVIYLIYKMEFAATVTNQDLPCAF